VYYAKMQTGGLWRVPVSGGAEEQVLDALTWGDWGHWTLTDGGVYFVRREGMNPAVLAFLDEATNAVRATEDVVWLLDGLGIASGIDLDGLVDTAQWISAALGRDPASRVARAVLAKRAKAASAN
jgi:hypothetical protein